MIRIKWFSVVAILFITACSATKNQTANISKSEPLANSLLWKISGPGLVKSSYLYGTMHMLCEEDAGLSDSVKSFIQKSDAVYFEADMDDLGQMMAILGKMKMKGDTTLDDLLSKDEVAAVKNYFDKNNALMPFSMIKTFKPMLATSLVMQKSFPCEKTAMMEQVLMEEAKKNKKNIEGLEELSHQAEIFDKIPYQLQADQLYQMISEDNKDTSMSALKSMLLAYRTQNLSELERLTVEEEAGMENFLDLLLYNRNRNWVEKLQSIMPGKSYFIAVGAGHLPGDQGVINLLKNKGYQVTPVSNIIPTQSK